MKRLLVLLLLAGCSQTEWEWGTVVGVTPDTGAMGCFGEIPYTTVLLDDGRVVTKCMNVPEGTRVQVCPRDAVLCSNMKPDPSARTGE